MSRPQSTTTADSTADRLIEEAEKLVRDQEVRLRSMIVQGAPTQSAEDLLRQRHTTLQEMKEHRRRLRASPRQPLPSSPSLPADRRGPR